MTMRATVVLVLGLIVACSVLGCGKGGSDKGEGSGKVLARVGDQRITEADLTAMIASMPKHEQPQYESVLGRKRLLNQMVDRLLLAVAAEDKGLDDSPEVANRMREFRLGVLNAEYRNYLVEQLPKPTEEDLNAYYQAHQNEFIVLPRVNVSWFKCAQKAQAEAARQRVVIKGEHFGTVAREVTIDECSKKDNGLIGYFNPGGYVRCIGNRPEFVERVFEMEADDVSEVFAWDGAWAVVKVHEKSTQRQEPFSKARERIAARLRPQLTDSILGAELGRLRQRFGAETFLDTSAELADKSAEDLMRMATEAGTSADKIDIYRALLEKYPRHERADEAQFMIGFVLSEELQDFETARQEYQKVLDNYPDSDIRESVLYMMQNMESPETPAFQESAPSSEPGR